MTAIQATICLLCALIGMAIGSQVGPLTGGTFETGSLIGLATGVSIYVLVRLDCGKSIDALEYAANR